MEAPKSRRFYWKMECLPLWDTYIGLIGPSHKKKVETIKAPKNRRFYWKMKCLPLWPTYIGEKGRTLGKTYGIKASCYWEHPWELREHIGNLMGTHWELEVNMLGTKENWKKSSPHPQNLKEKKSRRLECMLKFPIRSACWAFPLAAWNFYFQNYWSPIWPGPMAGWVIWGRRLFILH
jgi:hypothetical protein